MTTRGEDLPNEQPKTHEARKTMLKLTGLWTGRFEKDGEEKTFLSGSIGSLSLLVFPNGRKRNPADPDYLAFLAPSRKRAERQQSE